MQIPRGKAGKTLVAEMTRLIRLFNSSKRLESVAIHMLQIVLPLILQKPSLKSKNREHVKYLNKRIEWWKHGKLQELISKCEAIVDTAVFVYIIIISWLCQLLSCNFASLCVLAASAICGFSIRESFSNTHSQATLFISAALQTFCCRITEINFFRSCVSFSSISFVCVQYNRLLACVHSLRQRTCVPLQATKSRQNLQRKQTHHYSTAPSCSLFLLFYALRVSSHEPIHASFSKGGILI